MSIGPTFIEFKEKKKNNRQNMKKKWYYFIHSFFDMFYAVKSSEVKIPLKLKVRTEFLMYGENINTIAIPI